MVTMRISAKTAAIVPANNDVSIMIPMLNLALNGSLNATRGFISANNFFLKIYPTVKRWGLRKRF
jgi:hypothetical protein